MKSQIAGLINPTTAPFTRIQRPQRSGRWRTHHRAGPRAPRRPGKWSDTCLNILSHLTARIGRMRRAFSRCRTRGETRQTKSDSEYVGAGYWGRKDNGTTSARAMLVQAGRGYFNHHKWGDYSYTSLDPVDSSFWTIQEYSESNDTPVLWYIGLWISNLKVIP